MKTKEEILKEIFENDPLDLLNVKPQKSAARTSDERLATSFDEINLFFEKNNREPEPNPSNISEYQLYSRLKGMRENEQKRLALAPQDQYGLLKTQKKEIKSLDDIFDDDSFDILGDDSEGLFTFNHTPTDAERAKADFVARRKKCKNFDKYEAMFKQVQEDLASGKRKLIKFYENQLVAGRFFVHNGILLYLEEIQDLEINKFSKRDGRTRTIFENGTESHMKLRSLGKNLFINGQGVTQTGEQVNDEFRTTFNEPTEITDDDKKAGYIYVLKSKSQNEAISSIEDLYKIGYSSTSVEERIKNAENETTYLMADVEIIGIWEVYNMNAQKFENLIHRFFGNSCLNIEVADNKKILRRPREWFVVPIKRIEEAIEMIIDGSVVNYVYDSERGVFIEK